MKHKVLFLTLLGIDFILLLLQIQKLSISYNEARIVFEDATFLHNLLQYSFTYFGQNDYALRVPMLFLHLISVILLYQISRIYLKREEDALWVVVIYILLPGVTSSALVVNEAGLTICFLFFFIFMYMRYERKALIVLPLFSWIDHSLLILYIATVLFGIYRRELTHILIGAVALFLSIYFFGVNIGGAPKSHFIDLLGVYIAVFSPLVFVYIFYVLYRKLISKEWDFIWMIAITSFIISLMLSFRQKIHVQEYAPYLLLVLPLAAQTFLSTFRIRLPEFRQRYIWLFYSTLVLLIVNAGAVFFHQNFYPYLKDPTRHFSYPMSVAKELAYALKAKDINCVQANDKKLQLRLKFYGINECSSNLLSNKNTSTDEKVTISYKNTPIYYTYVTKIRN